MNTDTVDRINRYIDRIEKYYVTYDVLETMYSELDPSLTEEETRKVCYEYINEQLNDPAQDKAFLYYYLAMYTEDVNELKTYLENCINEDNTYLDVKVQLANILRRQDNLQNAEKYCDEVLSEDKNNSGALRGLAVIKLLKGNKEEGLDLAYEAFDINPEEPYAWETYIIALNENAKNSDLDAQIKKYIAEGYEVEQDTQKYLEGKLSLHDYYIGE